jgi:hypothetical protein
MAERTKSADVGFDDFTIDLHQETKELIDCLSKGDVEASTHLARLVEADRMDTLGPFAHVLCARLCDHLQRYAALGIVDPVKALKDDLYDLIKSAARDLDSLHRSKHPAEEGHLDDVYKGG